MLNGNDEGSLVLPIRGIRVAGFSLQHRYHSNPTTPKLQHTSKHEQYDRCGNSTEESQAPDDGYIKLATRISLQPNHTETPTHIEPRKIRPMWQFNRIVASS